VKVLGKDFPKLFVVAHETAEHRTEQLLIFKNFL